MTQPNPFQPPPKPWWVKALIVLGVVSGILVLAAVSIVGFVFYTCSHH
jgi:hypothetical protein